MSEWVRSTLAEIKTVDDMVRAFSDEERCRLLMERMIWPRGRICPACGYRRSIALAGHDMGTWRARPAVLERPLPVSVHGDDTYSFAFHQVAAQHVAEGAVADPAIG